MTGGIFMFKIIKIVEDARSRVSKIRNILMSLRKIPFSVDRSLAP